MPRQLDFAKGHGTMNDFVVFADPDGAFDPTAEQVRFLCDRRAGVGADGVLRVVPGRFVAGWSGDPDAWFMDYRNADGSLAEMCGNGIRVFAKFVLDHGYAELEPGSTLPIATRAGVRDVTRSASGFQVDLGRWRLDPEETLVRARDLPVARPGQGINVGNPHIVVAVADDAELDAIDLAYPPLLEPRPEHGANVEFVVPLDPMVVDGVGAIRMRVHERGVGETLSCGSGVAAAALAVRHWAGATAPNQWRVDVPGGTLGVRMFPTEEGEHVGLSGPAALVYSGTITLKG